jgi:hypothetical protein
VWDFLDMPLKPTSQLVRGTDRSTIVYGRGLPDLEGTNTEGLSARNSGVICLEDAGRGKWWLVVLVRTLVFLRRD